MDNIEDSNLKPVPVIESVGLILPDGRRIDLGPVEDLTVEKIERIYKEHGLPWPLS